VEGVVLVSVINALAEPEKKVVVVIVCVLPAVKITEEGFVVAVIASKVLLPLIVKAPAPPWLRVPYDPPAPVNDFEDAEFILIVYADDVKFVGLLKVHVAPVTVIVPLAPVIDRTPLPVEETVPVVNVYPAKDNVPAVSVVTAFVANVRLAARVVVPAPLIVNEGNVVLPVEVIVPVPTIVAVNAEYVPVLDNVNAFKFSAVVPGLKEVVPKPSVLNQLAVVNVAILAPVVNVRLGAIVVDPPVVPQVNVLVLLMAATVNPPVPV